MADGLERTPPRGPQTPGRPPRMPRFDRERATGASDRRMVQRLDLLTAGELIALVKDVELRFRQLAAFETEEIRRAQRVGFSVAGFAGSVCQTAW